VCTTFPTCPDKLFRHCWPTASGSKTNCATNLVFYGGLRYPCLHKKKGRISAPKNKFNDQKVLLAKPLCIAAVSVRSILISSSTTGELPSSTAEIASAPAVSLCPPHIIRIRPRISIAPSTENIVLLGFPQLFWTGR